MADVAIAPQVHGAALALDARDHAPQPNPPMLCYVQPKGEGGKKPTPYAGHFSQDTTACAPPIWFEPDAEYGAHRVSLTDMRGLAPDRQPTLDVHGFEYAKQPTRFFEDGEAKITDEARLAEYCRELERFVQERLGAKRVFVFEPPHFRKRLREVSYSVPVTEVHIDVSEESARKLVRHFYPDECDELLSRRYQVINIWRPLFDNLSDWPLALCDARTVDRGDLVETMSPYPFGFAHSWQLYFNPAHAWYFVDRQHKDEVLLFKSFDSEAAAGGMQGTPHAAVDIARVQNLSFVRKRESVEARVLVFY